MDLVNRLRTKSVSRDNAWHRQEKTNILSRLVEAPGVESRRPISVSIRFDRFRTALPSVTVKKSRPRHPFRSISMSLAVET